MLSLINKLHYVHILSKGKWQKNFLGRTSFWYLFVSRFILVVFTQAILRTHASRTFNFSESTDTSVLQTLKNAAFYQEHESCVPYLKSFLSIGLLTTTFLINRLMMLLLICFVCGFYSVSSSPCPSLFCTTQQYNRIHSHTLLKAKINVQTRTLFPSRVRLRTGHKFCTN